MITPEYHQVITETRNNYPSWGSGGTRHAEPVIQLLQDIGVRTGKILDYGSGIGCFGNAVRQQCGNRYVVHNYEPTLPQWSELPTGIFDAVVSTHVLEHVEPEMLNDTLAEIWSRAGKLVYLEIPHGPAKEVLPDGRNAHLIQEEADWWLERITKFFPRARIVMPMRCPGRFSQFVVYLP